MALPTTIADAIELAAKSPKKTKVDGTEIEEHDLKSLIAADDHTAAKTAGEEKGDAAHFKELRCVPFFFSRRLYARS